MARGLAVVAMLVLCGAAPAAELARARDALEAYDYLTAQRALTAVRAQLAELSTPEANEALRLSAVVALSLDRPHEARDFLRALLDRWPDFSPREGEWPPPWRAVLDAVRAERDRQPPVVELDAPDVVSAGGPVVVRASVTDPAGIRDVKLMLTAPEVEVPMVVSKDGLTYSATVSAARVNPPQLVFWVAAYDLRGNGPGAYGPPNRPATIRVTPAAMAIAPTSVEPGDDSVFDRWWFWTLAAVVVAGAGVSAAVLAARPSDDASVRARIEFP